MTDVLASTEVSQPQPGGLSSAQLLQRLVTLVADYPART